MSATLTRRERNLYKIIIWLSSGIWIVAFLAYFLLGDRASRATLLEVCLFAINTMIMFGFGYALRSDLRVIRGIPWLQES